MSFETLNCVFNTTDENSSFSNTTPVHWISKTAEKTTNELNELSMLKSQNDIELYVEQVGKNG